SRPRSHLLRPASRHRRRADPARRRGPRVQSAGSGRNFAMMRTLGALVGARDKAERLCADLEARLETVRAAAHRRERQPRIYFEEWDEPMISGIGWVSELIAAAGGLDVFAERAANKSARNRIALREEIIAAAPDIIIG